VLAVDWANFAYAGAFVLGALTGSIVTVRLSKVIADFFKGQRDRDA
jgi:hypothetical protein